jgi:hypothetical protein
MFTYVGMLPLYLYVSVVDIAMCVCVCVCVCVYCTTALMMSDCRLGNSHGQEGWSSAAVDKRIYLRYVLFAIIIISFRMD